MLITNLGKQSHFVKNVGVGEHKIGLVDMNSEMIVSKRCSLMVKKFLRK